MWPHSVTLTHDQKSHSIEEVPPDLPLWFSAFVKQWLSALVGKSTEFSGSLCSLGPLARRVQPFKGLGEGTIGVAPWAPHLGGSELASLFLPQACRW